MRVSILIVCFLFLSGCVAPITKDQLRQHSSYKVDFEINKPYQQVFSDLLRQTRVCYLNKPTKRQITVVGNRDNGKKIGNIMVEEVYAMAEHDAYLLIDVVSKTENLTTVSAYISAKAQEEVDSVKAWATENSKECHVKWLS